MISYSDPLSRAWSRMRLILFSPFDIGKWFVLGFTAWIATLADGNGPRNLDFDWKPDFWNKDWGESAAGKAEWIQDFFTSGIELFLVLFIIFAAIVIGLLLLWISSRGAFMFLDNVVHNRSRVTDPWRQFSRLGDSLFLWRLLFGLANLIVIGGVVVLAVLMALPLRGDGVIQGLGIVGLVLTILFAIFLVAVATFIEMLVKQFVVPLMYKHGLTVMPAWRMFWPLLRAHLGSFVLFGLFFLVLSIGLFIVAAIFGLVTCCVGLLLLMIPYLGAVLWLPVHVLFRGFGLEFLDQFGPAYSVRDQFPENRPPDPNPVV